MNTNQMFAKAKYIIYCSWETKSQYGSTIGGSSYYNEYPNNESEAIEMLEKVKKNSEEFHAKFPSKDTTRRYGYHLNNPDWWIR
jgi:hypothetical protein